MFFIEEDFRLIEAILGNQESFVSRYSIKKSSGKLRPIISPVLPYKTLQKKIKYWLDSRKVFQIHDSSYAWVPKRSRTDCARFFVGMEDFNEFDIQDYFGSITMDHLIGILIYNPIIPELLNLLNIDLNQLAYILSVEKHGRRILPQGFCTSPLLANAVRYQIDCELEALAATHQMIYKNYGDNLYFVGMHPVPELYMLMVNILKKYGFTSNYRKYKHRNSGQKQNMLGVIVNKKLAVDKQYVIGLIDDILHATEVDSKLLGRIHNVALSDNPRNYNYLIKLLERIHGTKINQ